MTTTSEHTLPVLYKRTVAGNVQEWEIWVEKTKHGTGLMMTRYGLQGGKKQQLREEITQGKNLGKKNATSPYEQAVLEATARWNKQKDRKGYGLDMEESAKIRAASPMLAQKYQDHAKKVRWDTAFAQPKLNGYRCLIRRNAQGKLVATSRENLPLQVPHILTALRDAVDEGVTLDGELYTHGMPLNVIASACKKLDHLTNDINYNLFDLVTPEDYGARYTDLHGILSRAKERVGAPCVLLVETVKVRSEGELMTAQAHFVERGYEGAMLRHGHQGYEAGKRSQNLLKVKTFQDAEFKVVDYKMGRGKFAGVAVFTCVTAAGHEFDVLIRGSMEERQAVAAQANQMVGKMLTVKFQEFTKTAEPVPFHAIGLGFRD